MHVTRGVNHVIHDLVSFFTIEDWIGGRELVAQLIGEPPPYRLGNRPAVHIKQVAPIRPTPPLQGRFLISETRKRSM